MRDNPLEGYFFFEIVRKFDNLKEIDYNFIKVGDCRDWEVLLC